MKLIIPLLVFLLLVPCAFAQGATVSLSEPYESFGYIVVDVKIDNAEDLNIVGFQLSHNRNVLELDRLMIGDFKGEVMLNKDVQSISYGKAVYMAPGITGISDSGIIGKFRFKVLDSAKADTLQLLDIEVVNDKAKTVASNVKSNALTYTPGDIPNAPLASDEGDDTTPENDVDEDEDDLGTQEHSETGTQSEDVQAGGYEQVSVDQVNTRDDQGNLEQSSGTESSQTKTSQSKSPLLYIVVILLVLGLAVGGFFAYKKYGSSTGEPEVTPAPQPVQQ